MVKSYWKKGRLRTLSSTHESRKFRPEENATEASMLGVLYPVHITYCDVSDSTILHGVGYQVAYPGQGNARARAWDRRVRAPTSFIYIYY